MSKFLALDLSKKNTGYALFEDGTLAKVGSKSFTNYGSERDMFQGFQDWLQHRARGCDDVAYEVAKPRNMSHSAIHFGMIAIVRLRFADHHVHGVTWSTAKKVLTGNGHASKDDMLSKARELYPSYDIQNHDEADAIAVGLAYFADQMLTPF